MTGVFCNCTRICFVCACTVSVNLYMKPGVFCTRSMSCFASAWTVSVKWDVQDWISYLLKLLVTGPLLM